MIHTLSFFYDSESWGFLLPVFIMVIVIRLTIHPTSTMHVLFFSWHNTLQEGCQQVTTAPLTNCLIAWFKLDYSYLRSCSSWNHSATDITTIHHITTWTILHLFVYHTCWWVLHWSTMMVSTTTYLRGNI